MFILKATHIKLYIILQNTLYKMINNKIQLKVIFFSLFRIKKQLQFNLEE